MFASNFTNDGPHGDIQFHIANVCTMFFLIIDRISRHGVAEGQR